MKKIISIIIGLIFISIFCLADTIVLQDGTTIDGDIIYLDEDIILIKTDEGTKKIKRNQVDRAIIQKDSIDYSKHFIKKEGTLFLSDMDYGDGYIVHDKSDYINHGTIENANWISDNDGKGINFDGTYGDIVIKQDVFNSMKENFTIKILCKPKAYADTSLDFLVSRWNTYQSSPMGSFIVGLNKKNQIVVWIANNKKYDSMVSENSLIVNQVNFIEVRFKNGKLSIYLNSKFDNEKVTKLKQITSENFNNGNLYVGGNWLRTSNAYSFNGIVYKVHILNRSDI